jgi:alkanesulfonate monooxygenase SsuD/methylene tetrahydromethanopterin reductase-like flavin-dependent oxidoreductase (luciferase family)
VNLGVVALPQLPPERLPALAAAADEAGLDELWLWEDCFLAGGVSAAAAVLAGTTRLRVGVGLLPVPLRNVALTAMELATLYRMFPGRVRAGIGHGVQDWMGQTGARVASPMTLLREYASALRALLAGDRVTTSGRYVRLDRVALDHPPLEPAPLLMGATGPRTLRLAGELADGTVLTGGTTPDQVRAARSAIDEGRRIGGRTGAHPIVVYLHAAAGPDADDRLDRERQRWGYPSATDRMVAGDGPALAAQIERWAAAGADTVVLQPTADDPDLPAFVRLAAGLPAHRWSTLL